MNTALCFPLRCYLLLCVGRGRAAVALRLPRVRLAALTLQRAVPLPNTVPKVPLHAATRRHARGAAVAGGLGGEVLELGLEGVDAYAAGDLGGGAEGADLRRPAARLKAMRAAIALERRWHMRRVEEAFSLTALVNLTASEPAAPDSTHWPEPSALQ